MIKENFPEKITKMAKIADITSEIISELIEMTKPGMTTKSIDIEAKRLIEKHNVISTAFNQRPFKGNLSFPGQICICRNDEVTHGFGKKDVFFEEGDLVSFDVALKKDGYCADMARSFILGKGTKTAEKLIEVTKEALQRAIKASKTGCSVGDIGFAIQSFTKSQGFSVVKSFVGHTIGQEMWEEPQIPGFGNKGEGQKLERFHTIAMDTMVNEGGHEIFISDEDNWTVVTRDHKLSCLFEDTYYVDDLGGVKLTW